MTLCSDDIDNSVNAAAAYSLVLSLNHNSYKRLCTALTNQDSSRIAKLCGYLVHLRAYIGISLCSSLILYLDILKHLRIHNKRSSKLAELLLA